MRFLATIAVAAFLLMPAAAPSFAHHTGKLAGATEVSVSAAKKKAKKANSKKEEYLRAVPAR